MKFNFIGYLSYLEIQELATILPILTAPICNSIYLLCPKEQEKQASKDPPLLQDTEHFYICLYLYRHSNSSL